MTSSKDLALVVPEEKIKEIKKLAVFKEVVNTEPPQVWVKSNQFANDSKYIPIDKVELMMDTIFTEWQVEIKSISQLAQSIVAVVRVHYKDPVSQEWRFHDGVGGQELKTDKGYSAADLAHIKTDAVRAGAPAAVSRAIRDACEHIGKLFGRDLNRKDSAQFHSVYTEIPEKESAWPTSQSGASVEVLLKLAQLRSEKTQKPLMESINWAFDLQTETEVQQWIDHFQLDGPTPGEAKKQLTEEEIKKKLDGITKTMKIDNDEVEKKDTEELSSSQADDAYEAKREADAEASEMRMQQFIESAQRSEAGYGY